LVLQQSGGLERSIDIWDKPFYMLGRFGADVLLHGEGASRTHAVIFHNESGETCIEDLGSRHGTFIHDFRLEPHCPHHWKDGVIVTFGPPHKRDRAWLVTSALPIRGSPRPTDSEVRSQTIAMISLASKSPPSVLPDKILSRGLPPSSNDSARQSLVSQAYCNAEDNEDAKLEQVPKRQLDVMEPLAKRQKVSFADLWSSKEDVVEVAAAAAAAAPPELSVLPSRKASELWNHSL
jgi:hypothetical protein